MGFFHSTYAFYGVHVPKDRWRTHHIHDETDLLDHIIPGMLLQDVVTYVTAGAYDRDELFLAVKIPEMPVEVPLGDFLAVPDTELPTGYLPALHAVAMKAGYSSLDAPGWYVVPDMS